MPDKEPQSQGRPTKSGHTTLTSPDKGFSIDNSLSSFFAPLFFGSCEERQGRKKERKILYLQSQVSEKREEEEEEDGMMY